jgi:uncharacterized protein
MKKNFLGKGIAFPLRVTNRGNLALSAEERSIDECVRIVIGTSPGERVMRPDFGCRVHELIFHPNNNNTASMASFYVEEALVKWEPRIKDVKVEAFPDPSAENILQLSISYRVISTNYTNNMVYPFYLRKEEVQ